MLPCLSFFSLSVPTYGLCAVLGLLLGFALAALRVRRAGLSAEALLQTVGIVLLGVLLGGKLLYLAVTFTPPSLLTVLRAGDLTPLFGGGMVYYGGLLGGLLALPPGARFAGVKPAPYLSAALPSIPLAHAVGRVGCYLAGCCYGFPYGGPLSQIPADASLGTAFPVPLAEAAGELVLCAALVLLGRRRTLTLPTYLAPYAVLRFLLEFLRGDEGRGVWLLSTSQWISLFILLTLIGYRCLRTRK